jgi:hypothetical protein
MKAAYATIKGFEVIMRMFRKRQCILLKPGMQGKWVL